MIRENNNDTPKKWADREREPYGHEKTVYSFSERLRKGERDFQWERNWGKTEK